VHWRGSAWVRSGGSAWLPSRGSYRPPCNTVMEIYEKLVRDITPTP
jgi:hypothetical protein